MDTAAGNTMVLEKLLTDARRITSARAGTVYLREPDGLRFAVAQNDDLAAQAGEVDPAEIFARSALGWRERSIASYVALTRSIVNIPDVYEIPPDKPYSFNPRLDMKTGFRTRSMLVLPLRSVNGSVYGVLQLINATDARGAVVAFDRRLERVVEALAADASAVA